MEMCVRRWLCRGRSATQSQGDQNVCHRNGPLPLSLNAWQSPASGCGRVRVGEEQPANDDAPSHRIYAGRAEIGAAWTKTSRENRSYLSLKLDDPSFAAPIFANLFEDAPGEYSLIWSRSRS